MSDLHITHEYLDGVLYRKAAKERDEARAEVARLKDIVAAYEQATAEQSSAVRPEPSRLEIAARFFTTEWCSDYDTALEAADELIAAAKGKHKPRTKMKEFKVLTLLSQNAQYLAKVVESQPDNCKVRPIPGGVEFIIELPDDAPDYGGGGGCYTPEQLRKLDT